jgi:hypothetical protein
MGGALGSARQHRQGRRGAVQRLDLGLLIDAQHDGTLRRIEIQPDDIADLVDEQRSFDSFQLSWRCGCSPNARQILTTAVWLSPTSAAIDRVDQCVASFGALSSVLVITSSTWASVILRG